jgi:hypothetical protein
VRSLSVVRTLRKVKTLIQNSVEKTKRGETRELYLWNNFFNLIPAEPTTGFNYWDLQGMNKALDTAINYHEKESQRVRKAQEKRACAKEKKE